MEEKADLFPHDSSLERLPAPERDRQMSWKLQRLIAYAYNKAPGFKQRMDGAGIKPGDIKALTDLQRIPVLRKDDLIKLQKELPPFGGYLAVPLDEIDHIYQSPGPIYDPQRRLKQGTLPPDMGKGQTAINTWSYHITPAGLLIDRLLRAMGFTVFPAGTGNTDLLVQVMRDLKVSYFVGTPSFLAAIIKRAEEMGYDIKKDFNLKYAQVFGEMGGDPLRKMFTERYGITCIGGDNYLTADIGPIAGSCEKVAGMHVNTDVIVEIVDPATGRVLPAGEVGEVVVTPFDEVYPLIRFGTGDLSMLVTETCACGRTTARLPKIMGRSGDAVRVRAMFVHPRQTDEVTSKFGEIARYRILVSRPADRDEMLLQVELKSELAERGAWEESLRKEFQNTCKVRFDTLEVLPAGSIPVDEKKIIDRRVY
ncbi:MAG: phenylacetate--CoA ligase family protein [Dehalococcoidia bacterium]